LDPVVKLVRKVNKVLLGHKAQLALKATLVHREFKEIRGRKVSKETVD
jgi:hypothetical protein